MNITLPAIVNGQILPGGVDRYRFQARKGQQLVVAATARELIPYLADAVPGWFQAALALYDAKGKELAYADDYRFHPDPVLHYEIPEDGEYVVEIRDSIYRGREDFVYRITVGELPFVTSIFPLGGRAGAQTTVELKGWNLPVTSLTLDATQEPGVYPLAVRKEDRISNRVPFAVDTLPECLEQEPNNTMPAAQPVTLPIIVNGRIDRPGDWDVFRFEGRAGDADRRGSLCPPARLAAGFGAQADRRRRQATGLQRRPRGQGRGLGHAPRRFLSHRHAARRRGLLPPPGRRAAQGRPGVRLPPAHQPAAARFRVARRAVQPQRPRRRVRPAHRLCPAPGRLRRRDRAGVEGRARRDSS